MLLRTAQEAITNSKHILPSITTNDTKNDNLGPEYGRVKGIYDIIDALMST